MFILTVFIMIKNSINILDKYNFFKFLRTKLSIVCMKLIDIKAKCWLLNRPLLKTVSLFIIFDKKILFTSNSPIL